MALLAMASTNPGAGTAQGPDSAQVARTEARAAGAALRRGDSVQALTSLDHAVRAWPAQGAYRLRYANLAARMGRLTDALAELDTLVLLGYGWGSDEPVALLAGSDSRYHRTRAAMLRETAPLDRSTVVARLPDTLLHPEGVAWDGARRRWLVSSIRQRRIVAVDTAGRVTEFVPPGRDGLDAVFGMAVDSARGLLWVASSAMPNQLGYAVADSGRAGIFAFDLVTGRVVQRAAPPAVPGGHVLGDLVIGRSGEVFVSDSRFPAVYRLRPGAGALEAVAQGAPHFRSLQGLAFAEDGRSLYLADWSHGLLCLDLETGAVQPVALGVPGTLLGIDGLLRIGPRTLLGIQNGIVPPRVVQLTLSSAGDRVERLEVVDRHLPLASEPTLGTLGFGGMVYVANSPWSNYDDDGVPLAGASWPPPALLFLPLPLQ